MKKIYFFALSAFVSLSVSAQVQTETFENFTLNSDGYLVGENEPDWIVGSALKLTSNYNSDYDYWGGFAISNVQDITTPGYLNQYASITNGGENSSNYAVFYSSGEIVFSRPVLLKEMSVTNTTYATLSMKHGDAYGKVFGSNINAQGIDDGTNGKDFFSLTINFKKHNDEMLTLNKIVYLADFRFDNDADDYILEEWKKITFNDPELINTPIKSLHFSMSSSDVNEFGMVTPAYFALDNLKFEQAVLNSETIAMNTISIYPNPTKDNLTIVGEMQNWTITDLTGKEIATGNEKAISVQHLNAGMYQLVIVSNEHTTVKRFQKL